VILFPAIDLKDGLAVRLQQGDMARATVFNRDPAAQAAAFERQGFDYLHIVDLDGAVAGRPIIGTAAVRDPTLVKEAARQYPGRIAVGLDARDGKVAVEGWAATSELSALDIARRFEDSGVAAIVYTDAARDGMLKGLNLDATIVLSDAVSIPVIASGGLASIDDVRALLLPRAKKLAGAIAGRALYDGRLDAAEALALLRGARATA